MRSPTSATAAALVTASCLAACGGGPVAPPGMAYTLPSPASVTYGVSDTTRLDIDANGETMRASISALSRLGATFRRGTDGLQVTLTVKKYDARMENPVGMGASADESQISGPLVFSLDRRGGVAVASEPEVSGAARQFFSAVSLAHSFFPRLPGRAVDVGAAWTDTIGYSGKQGDGDVTSQSVVTYSVTGDTLVGGRRLVRIELSGDVSGRSSGFISGMDYTQEIHGTLSGWVLWDHARGLMVEHVTRTLGQGSMEVSAAPFPLGIRLRQQVEVRLQDET